MARRAVLIAPEMVDLAESHRMSSFARAFAEMGHFGQERTPGHSAKRDRRKIRARL